MPSDCALHGMDSVLEKLERLGGARMLGAAERALAASLEDVRAQAQALCPRDTGALAASLRTELCREGNAVSGTVKSSLPYAMAVEMGSHGRAAQPFLYPAYKANERGVLGGVQAAMLGGEEV